MNNRSISTGRIIVSIAVVIATACLFSAAMLKFLSRLSTVSSVVYAIMIGFTAFTLCMSICLTISMITYLANASDRLINKMNVFGILLFDGYFGMGIMFSIYGTIFAERLWLIAVSGVAVIGLLAVSIWNMHDRNISIVKRIAVNK